MDVLDLYIKKNLQTENGTIPSINKLFISNENIYKLTKILYRELYIYNNEKLFNELKQKVILYSNKWVEPINTNGDSSLDKFITKSFHNHNEKLDYINNLFINYYKNKLLDGKTFYEHEIQNNPYKKKYDYKIKNIDSYPSENLNDSLSFNNYNTKYTTNLQFSNKYHKIPYYEKSLYRKNIDKDDNGSFRERKLLNNNFKKYNNNELLNNIDYLK